MKKILYLFVIAVLLAACTSKNEVRTYNNGKDLTYKYHSETQKTDTISFEDNNIPLSVLVENDTVWFHSNIFRPGGLFISPYLIFENKSAVKPNYEFDLYEYSDYWYDYYAIIDTGKFFNTKDFKSVSLIVYHDGKGVKSIYYLDLDQFKHLNK